MQPKEADNNNPFVAVVIVGWKSKEDLPECLDSLRKQDYKNFKVVFVGNDVSDGSEKLIRKNYPEVLTLNPGKNLYFGGGNNLGMRFAMKKLNPSYIAILNPDTYVAANWLSSQISFMQQHPKAGIVGPKVIFAAEKNQTINSAGLEEGGFLFPYDRGFGQVDHGQFDSPSIVFGLSGVSMFMRSEMLKQVGGFNEAFKMYLEDAELCLRAKRAGWENWYLPFTTVWHKHMRSTKKAGNSKYIHWSNHNYLLMLLIHYPLRKFLRGVSQVLKSKGLFFAMYISTRALMSKLIARSNTSLT